MIFFRASSSRARACRENFLSRLKTVKWREAAVSYSPVSCLYCWTVLNAAVTESARISNQQLRKKIPMTGFFIIKIFAQ